MCLFHLSYYAESACLSSSKMAEWKITIKQFVIAMILLSVLSILVSIVLGVEGDQWRALPRATADGNTDLQPSLLVIVNIWLREWV